MMVALAGLAVFLFHVLGFASSVHAVMSTRTAQGAIAWAVSLNTFPYLAVPAYWVLGRSRFEGYVLARRNANAGVGPSEQRVLKAISPFRVPAEERPDSARAAEELAGMPIVGRNRAELLVDGEATFDSILGGISEAKDYVLFQFFIVRDDDLGRRLKEHLVAKAREGVRVYFLYDEIGCHDLPSEYLQGLSEAGIQVHEFNTRKGFWNRFQLNFRNHRKIVVVDGVAAWIGGHNVGDEYLGKDPKFGHWRDTHLRVEGPAVQKAQLSFAEDWFWATETIPEVDWEPQLASDGTDSPVLVIPTGPADDLETANLMFVHAINTARDRIWIASPYFVPDVSVIVALQLAGLRGVDVRVLIPDRPDHLLVFLAAYSYFDAAGKTGVKFYRYQDGFLHQKVMLIDDDVATVGTANFDNRSFRLNFEVTVAVADPEFVGQVERMLEADFAKSRVMEEGEYDAKPWWFRLGVRLARLTAPIQ